MAPKQQKQQQNQNQKPEWSPSRWMAGFSQTLLLVRTRTDSTGAACLRVQKRAAITPAPADTYNYIWSVNLYDGPISFVEGVAKTQDEAKRAVETIIRILEG